MKGSQLVREHDTERAQEVRAACGNRLRERRQFRQVSRQSVQQVHQQKPSDNQRQVVCEVSRTTCQVSIHALFAFDILSELVLVFLYKKIFCYT